MMRLCLILSRLSPITGCSTVLGLARSMRYCPALSRGKRLQVSISGKPERFVDLDIGAGKGAVAFLRKCDMYWTNFHIATNDWEKGRASAKVGEYARAIGDFDQAIQKLPKVLKMRPTTTPSASTSKSSSFHSPDGREAEARLRISCPAIERCKSQRRDESP